MCQDSALIMAKHSMLEIFAVKRTLVSKVMSIHNLTRMQIHFRDRIGCSSFGGSVGTGIYARKTEWERKKLLLLAMLAHKLVLSWLFDAKNSLWQKKDAKTWLGE